jgi:hypothetical protein
VVTLDVNASIMELNWAVEYGVVDMSFSCSTGGKALLPSRDIAVR